VAKIRCEVVEGLMPSEKVAKIHLADGGVEEVSVSIGLIDGDYLRAAELARRAGRVLVELPTESASGNWRVWVPQDAVR
jgi:hypothetical protein